MQLEQLPRRSPRMVITPRQIEDRSQEIQSLKTELAGLRDEVRYSCYLCSSSINQGSPVHALFCPYHTVCFCGRVSIQACSCAQCAYPFLCMSYGLLFVDTLSARLQLRTVRGQLASAVSASAAAEGRVRLLSSQVKERDDAIAQMREEHDAAVNTLKQVHPLSPAVFRRRFKCLEEPPICFFLICRHQVSCCMPFAVTYGRVVSMQSCGVLMKVTVEAAQLRRNSVDQELPGQELAVLQANYGAMSAKHEEALGKLAMLQAAKEAAESSKASALAEAAVHQQNARTHAIRRAPIYPSPMMG